MSPSSEAPDPGESSWARGPCNLLGQCLWLSSPVRKTLPLWGLGYSPQQLTDFAFSCWPGGRADAHYLCGASNPVREASALPRLHIKKRKGGEL